jgi:NAD(P)-dependent dehydrogenase (short-subunit alcohol dehydrogenase family)
MRHAVVTGANRGLGLEFVRQALDAGDHVVATCRHPERADELRATVQAADGRATLVPLDIGDPASIQHAADRVAAQAPTVELLVNNAGVHDVPGRREASSGPLEALDPDALVWLFRVNALGPVLVTRALRPLLAAAAADRVATDGRPATVVNITSGVGSFAEQWGERYWGYALSKVALNMATTKLAAALQRDRIAVVAMNPGWVRTAIGGPDATLSPQESVRDLLATFDGLDQDRSGAFLDRHGQRLPW